MRGHPRIHVSTTPGTRSLSEGTENTQHAKGEGSLRVLLLLAIPLRFRLLSIVIRFQLLQHLLLRSLPPTPVATSYYHSETSLLRSFRPPTPVATTYSGYTLIFIVPPTPVNTTTKLHCNPIPEGSPPPNPTPPLKTDTVLYARGRYNRHGEVTVRKHGEVAVHKHVLPVREMAEQEPVSLGHGDRSQRAPCSLGAGHWDPACE